MVRQHCQTRSIPSRYSYKYIQPILCFSLIDIPKIVANNWKTVDPITKQYIERVAALLEENWAQITADSLNSNNSMVDYDLKDDDTSNKLRRMSDISDSGYGYDNDSNILQFIFRQT